MKTMYILLSCGQCQSVCQPVIDAVTSISWGLIGLVAIYLVLSFVAAPLIANCHECKVQKEDFVREKFWAYLKKFEEPIQKELDKCKKEIEELHNADEKRKKEKAELVAEKEKFEKNILEEKVKAYKDIINHIGRCIH